MWNSAPRSSLLLCEHWLMSRPFIFKCPITNQHVQGWLEDEDAQVTDSKGWPAQRVRGYTSSIVRPASCWEPDASKDQSDSLVYSNGDAVNKHFVEDQ